jgi:hypothetical protein
MGNSGMTGIKGNSCICSRPIIFTKTLNTKKLNVTNEDIDNYYLLNHTLDVAIKGPGLLLAWANGGIHLPNKYNAMFRLNFVTQDVNNNIEFFFFQSCEHKCLK